MFLVFMGLVHLRNYANLHYYLKARVTLAVSYYDLVDVFDFWL